MRYMKNNRSYTLPLEVTIVSWGYSGYTVHICFWKYVVEWRFKWPKGRMLLHCDVYYLLPCIRRDKGFIYGTPHGDFDFDSLELCWFNRHWTIWKGKQT